MARCPHACRPAIAVEMGRSPPLPGAPPSPLHLWPLNLNQCRLLSDRSSGLLGCGFALRGKARFKRRFRFYVCAEIRSGFSPGVGFDSQIGYSQDTSQLPWIGPVPGDIAEIEAYCRIFRAAERLHAALMDTLCNPLTGECAVPYDFLVEEKPLLEDKIVSVLGCVLSLLNKAREDVLSGRSSIMNSFRAADVSMMEDGKLPPLAMFRSEMKRCCESLHVALENIVTPDDEQSLDVWRKLQRLKNVCFDSGFPRGDGYPSHLLFANWSPVSLSPSREDLDSEVAFWKGGQVTDEGLKWLIANGFKTIVDLRAETIKDNLYQLALDEAISSGNIELIKIPVEVGTAPTMDQVEKFASTLSDCSKKPIYLHSKEGVWRTSAMVSRCRQHMSRFEANSAPSKDAASEATNGIGDYHKSLVGEEGIFAENEDDPLRKSLEMAYSSNGASHGKLPPNEYYSKEDVNGTYSPLCSSDSVKSLDTDINRAESSNNSFINIDPLKSQFPPSNIFSKTEMSSFLNRKKISPPTYFLNQSKKLETAPASSVALDQRTQKDKSAKGSPVSSFAKSGSPNGSLNVKSTSQMPQKAPANDRMTAIEDDLDYSSPSFRGLGSERISSSGAYSTVGVNNNVDENLMTETNVEERKRNAESSLVNGDNGTEVEGNMCASATGVVRVQSRKKAEMFLVRTDGFSCAREKVTESSLAFTHPSTQQQMLMWKTTPRTVLLLKKLGPELMEEAKEVASFLYYQEKMNVLVEPDVHDVFARIPGFGFVLTFYSQDTSDLHERVDFVACLGGDGVILHASNLFRDAVPPVVSFNLGSLGFLTSHKFDDYRQDLRQVVHGNNIVDGVYITLRMRLRCEIFRKGKAMPGKVFDVLNEVVVDRGSNPYLSKIECYEHDRLITKVQGDGVIIATPTGSTAYSTAAGGSMVHPSVPCMLFTPICPHSLSFRPVILPDSARLELKIPEDARSNAWVSFDGKRRQQLSRGDSVRISMSQHPLPTVNKCDQTGDWFRSLIRCLNWNERLDQRAL
ncbi:NAD kinase 2, chloroplastic isoform X2 [Rhodamnia argentea]|uniref:NAD(+) kinase n=1 Tax=Rhodamnia argentea TaxID=178133 RepID=A0A8B8NQ70_9MYRT|nr:NAD kinase 2, chloroplastic isoform X2 [Rhodamnia argentea]